MNLNEIDNIFRSMLNFEFTIFLIFNKLFNTQVILRHFSF